MAIAVPPENYPRLHGTPVAEVTAVEPTTATTYPPICEKTHWDPTQVFRRTVPNAHIAVPVDFRPWTKVNTEYRTTGPVEAPPWVPDSVVLPSGGAVFPPQRWSAHIDDESAVRRLDRPLTKLCDSRPYIPPMTGDMFQQHVLLPENRSAPTQFVQELAMPKALLRAAPYPCRAQADRYNMSRSSGRLFNNATKQDRYTPKQ